MTEGTVKFFNETKGFGFIEGEDGKEYFVHTTGLEESVRITEGDRVSFEVVQGDRGPKAEKVRKVEAGAEAEADNKAEAETEAKTETETQEE